MSLQPINRASENSQVFEPVEVQANRVDPYEGSSIQPCERRECSDGCARFFEIITYPFVFLFQIISYPFVFLYQLIRGAGDAPDLDEGLRLPGLIPPLEPSQELVDVARKYCINPERKKDCPDFNLNLSLQELQNSISRINIDEFMTHFDEVFTESDGSKVKVYGGKSIFSIDQDREQDVFLPENAMKECMEFYIKRVKERELNQPGASDNYYSNLEFFIKNIIHVVGKPEVDIDKKRSIILGLAKVCDKYGSEIYEETARQYGKIVKYSDAFENLCLEWIQDFKEDLILQAFQEERVILNDARRHIGDDYGLKNEVIMETDPPKDRRYDQNRYRNLLDAQYTVERVIHVVRRKFEQKNCREADAYIDYLYLNKKITVREYTATKDYWVDADGSSHNALNYKTIAIALENMGFLQKTWSRL